MSELQMLGVRQLEDKVVLIDRATGRAWEMPWYVAQELWRTIRNQAIAAEEYALAEQVAYDNATIRKAGIPIGLSNDAKIRKHTKWLIENDPKLNKYMGSGVQGDSLKVTFGKPDLVVHKDQEDKNAGI